MNTKRITFTAKNNGIAAETYQSSSSQRTRYHPFQSVLAWRVSLSFPFTSGKCIFRSCHKLLIDDCMVSARYVTHLDRKSTGNQQRTKKKIENNKTTNSISSWRETKKVTGWFIPIKKELFKSCCRHRYGRCVASFWFHHFPAKKNHFHSFWSP